MPPGGPSTGLARDHQRNHPQHRVTLDPDERSVIAAWATHAYHGISSWPDLSRPRSQGQAPRHAGRGGERASVLVD